MNDLLLSFHGTLLNNEQAIEELDLVSGATFDASVKVLGGKIHGNLSKVGKVKQATPKVNILFKKMRISQMMINFIFKGSSTRKIKKKENWPCSSS